ncbi:MAG: hypothetical protein IJ513_03745 [Bacteroidaceae bacterium]|nr:hypothetical protein [Bacteroidaceae bacterium]
MFNKTQSIIISKTVGSIEEMCLSILSQAEKKNALRISFFCKTSNNNEYRENISAIKALVCEAFNDCKPVVSYIAQGSSTGRLAAEVTYLTDNAASIERHNDYIIIKSNSTKEIITGGIIPHDISLSTFQQATEVFATIGAMLKENGFKPSDIYRQWNYIEGITSLNNGSQNYQEFNDARSHFYNSCEWSNGYPAATGIGTETGGVMIELNAATGVKNNDKPINNPVQIAAHSYSQNVLEGKTSEGFSERTTPKFERARLLGDTIYFSGTAAIKGEESNTSDCIIEQTSMTMSIIDRLIAQDNIPVPNNGASYNILRIYVKNSTDIPAVEEYMQEHYPSVPKHCLIGDICRPELLIEIEGTAHVK